MKDNPNGENPALEVNGHKDSDVEDTSGKKKDERDDDPSASRMAIKMVCSDTEDDSSLETTEATYYEDEDCQEYYEHTVIGETQLEKPDVYEPVTQEEEEEEEDSPALGIDGDSCRDNNAEKANDEQMVVKHEDASSAFEKPDTKGESEALNTAANKEGMSKDDEKKLIIRDGPEEVSKWVTFEADKGRKYYYNTETGETSWERPGCGQTLLRQGGPNFSPPTTVQPRSDTMPDREQGEKPDNYAEASPRNNSEHAPDKEVKRVQENVHQSKVDSMRGQNHIASELAAVKAIVRAHQIFEIGQAATISELTKLVLTQASEITQLNREMTELRRETGEIKSMLKQLVTQDVVSECSSQELHPRDHKSLDKKSLASCQASISAVVSPTGSMQACFSLPLPFHKKYHTRLYGVKKLSRKHTTKATGESS